MLRWKDALSVTQARCVLVYPRRGIAERLREISLAMGVAAAERRWLVVLWERDSWCDASWGELFHPPLPFVVFDLSEPVAISAGTFQTVDLHELPRRPSSIALDESRHLYLRSPPHAPPAHAPWHEWRFAASDEAGVTSTWLLQHAVEPLEAIANRVFTRRWMVGVHVQSSLDEIDVGVPSSHPMGPFPVLQVVPIQARTPPHTPWDPTAGRGRHHASDQRRSRAR